jgi:hypothetical protein
MNCCDAYGQCNQGRNCPVRATQALTPGLIVKVNQYLVAILFATIGAFSLLVFFGGMLFWSWML